jgi:hypothetical protein
MLENNPKTTTFERLVVRPIANGYLVEIETDSEDITHSFKTYRQVMRHIKQLDKNPEQE